MVFKENYIYTNIIQLTRQKQKKCLSRNFLTITVSYKTMSSLVKCSATINYQNRYPINKNNVWPTFIYIQLGSIYVYL